MDILNWRGIRIYTEGEFLMLELARIGMKAQVVLGTVKSGVDYAAEIEAELIHAYTDTRELF